MAPKPLVSIVTPSLNQSQFLEATICSVLSQDYPHIEYIICDGGSTDGSVEIIHKYKDRLAWWCSEKDEGQSAAINKGLGRAKGKILAWLNSDDCYLPGCVSTIVSAFERYPDAGLIFGNLEIIDEHGQRVKSFPYQDWTLADQLTHKVTLLQPASFWRREVMDSVGLLRTDLHYAMDLEFWIRIGRRYTIKSLDQVLAQYRVSSINKGSTQTTRWGPEFIKILDELYSEKNLTPDILSLKEKAYAGAYLTGARSLLYAYETLMARVWLRKAASLDPRCLYSSDWWQMYGKALLGRHIFPRCRPVAAIIKKSFKKNINHEA